MKTTKTPFVIATLAALAFAGCGETNTKTNPLEEYQDLKTVPKYTGNEPRVQEYEKAAAFSILVEKNLNFVEGESASYVITPRSMITGGVFRLVAKDLPEGATFGPVDGSKPMGDYKLTWAPAIGTLPDQARWDEFDAEIDVEVLQGADPVANERMAQMAVGRQIQLRLVPTKIQPVIEKCELASGVSCSQGELQITEGDSIAFTLTVKDAGSAKGRTPRLALDDDQGENKEMPRVAARRYTVVSRKPEAIGGGLFRFKGRIETKGMEFPAGAKSAIARVVAYVVSPSGLISPDEVIDVNVAKKAEPVAEPASPAPANKPAATANAGSAAKPAAKPAPTTNGTNKPAAAKPAAEKPEAGAAAGGQS